MVSLHYVTSASPSVVALPGKCHVMTED